MSKKEKNKIFIFATAFLAFAFLAGNSLANVRIESRASSSSNTGGNSGDSVATGSAQSESKIELEINSDSNSRTETKAELKVRAGEEEIEKVFEGERNIAEEVVLQSADAKASAEIFLLQGTGTETEVSQESNVPEAVPERIGEQAKESHETGLLQKTVMFLKKLFSFKNKMI